MDEPNRPSKDQSLLKVAVSDARQKEIKQNFYKLLPAVLWKPFLLACAEAHQMHEAKKINNVSETRDDMRRMLEKSQKLRDIIVQATPLTESYLPPNVLNQIDDLIASFSVASRISKTISSTKPSNAHRDILAFKIIGLMETSGVSPKLARSYNSRGNGDVYYRLMELAVEMAEKRSPSNLRKNMTTAKRLSDSIKKRKVAKIPH